jgi:hypothetical protein
LGGLSAYDADLLLPSWQAFTSREAFYAKVTSAVTEAMQGTLTKRQQRWATRMAILETMQACNLLTITRGSASSRAVKAEIFS